MNKQNLVFIYVFIALMGISISIHHHWQIVKDANQNQTAIKSAPHQAYGQMRQRQIASNSF